MLNVIGKISNQIENKKYLNILVNHEVFVAIYIISSILWFFPFLGYFLSPVCKVTFIWGILLVVYDLCTSRVFMKGSYWFLPVGFLISYMATIIVNSPENFYMGIKHFFYSLIVLFLVSTVMYGKEKKRCLGYLYKINNVIILIALIASTISILMYIFSISIEMEYFGNKIRQGFIDHRLFGVYTSANTGAMMGILSILFMCVNLYIKKMTIIKWNKIYCLNAIIQFIYFALSISRGGEVTACSVLVILLLVCFLPQTMEKLGPVKSIVTVTALFFSIIIISMAGIKLTRTSFEYLAQLVNSSKLSNTSSDNDELEKEIEFRRIESGDDLSNGRYNIWSGGLKVWEKSPLFGVADIRIDKEKLMSGKYDISDFSDEFIKWLDQADGNLHNAYIQIIVNSGIIGFVIMFIYALFMFIKYVKYLIDINNRSDQVRFMVVGMIFVVVIAFAVNGLFENRLLFDRQDPYGLMFWFNIGTGSALIGEVKEKRVSLINRNSRKE